MMVVNIVVACFELVPDMLDITDNDSFEGAVTRDSRQWSIKLFSVLNIHKPPII